MQLAARGWFSTKKFQGQIAQISSNPFLLLCLTLAFKDVSGQLHRCFLFLHTAALDMEFRSCCQLCCRFAGQV